MSDRLNTKGRRNDQTHHNTQHGRSEADQGDTGNAQQAMVMSHSQGVWCVKRRAISDSDARNTMSPPTNAHLVALSRATSGWANSSSAPIANRMTPATRGA